jgi:preprotein translocase subunit SecY
MSIQTILQWFPEIESPSQRRVSFNIKLKWTLIVLASFFVLANIALYGVSELEVERFAFYSLVMGTDFGSIITLGIGPIVTSSIILQLLVGSKILNIDLTTHEGKRYFQGLQKILVFVFIIFQAVVFVSMGAISALPGFAGVVTFQLVIGGIAIFYMDELTTKWGFGSGVSLFIAAGVGWRLFNSLFQFLGPEGGNCLINFGAGEIQCTGQLLVFLQSIILQNQLQAAIALALIVATGLIFALVVFAQGLKVEVPLSYDRLRGYGVRWPLAFFYTSVIPVILAAALVANVQMFGSLIQNWLGRPTFLGDFVNGQARAGLAAWITAPQPNLVRGFITGELTTTLLMRSFTYVLFFVVVSTIFAIFWMKTSGMDSSSQAKKIISNGLQVSGFRKDERVLESILDRYIFPLTIMGGAAIGFLAGFADVLGALISGTAVLLGIMIIFQLYQTIAQQHATDMNPAFRRFMG